jgi:hypothetical protein
VKWLEVLAGTRPREEPGTRLLLSTLVWHQVDAEVVEEAGALGRRWLPSHHTIDRRGRPGDRGQRDPDRFPVAHP